MEGMNLNNKSVNLQEGGSVSSAIAPMLEEFKKMAQDGMQPEEIVASMMNNGVSGTQMSQVLEAVGYTPDAIVQLFQTVELAERQKVEQQPTEPEVDMDQRIAQMANDVGQQVVEEATPEQPMMQFGGTGNRGAGPIFGRNGSIPRPIYLPPAPAKSNVLGAAFLLDDALGSFFTSEDRDGDGLMDGSFRDSKAKRARFKTSQNALNQYDINFQGNDPSNYMLNVDDLAEGKLRTKEQYQQDILDNSLVTGFNPEEQKYTGAIFSRESDFDKVGKKQKEELGILGEKRKGIPGFFGLREDPTINPDNTLASFLSRVEGLDPIQLEMMAEQLKGRDKETKGTGLNMNFQQYADKDQTPEQLQEMRSQYANIMMGSPMNSTTDLISSTFPIASGKDFGESTQRSIVQVDNQDKQSIVENKESFEDWAKKNQVKLQMKGLTTQAQQRAAFDAESQFKYGGDYLPKAQYGILGSGMGGVYADQLDFENLINNMQTDYASDTQAVADSQLQKENPALGATPLQNQQAITGSGPGSGMGSMFLDQQSLEKELGDLNQIDETADSLSKDTLPGPTIKKTKPLDTAIGKVDNFIKNDPAMRKFGDVSDFGVKSANLLNEMFLQEEEQNYKNELRNATNADKLYSVVEDPMNKRGTQDKNTGLHELDNLVDYYAQAMYGREMYKKGGEFEPHMMYDPKTGKAYEAKVEADHNRFAKMGFLHKDEMQDGGSVTPEMKAYLDALAFNKEARQAIGTNDREKLKQLRLDKPYSNNDLARDFSELQKLRQAAGLGLKEEASILFPHVGQQIRGGINSLLGTNFEQGGELEVDNDTLAALIAAGADIEIL